MTDLYLREIIPPLSSGLDGGEFAVATKLFTAFFEAFEGEEKEDAESA